MIRRAAAVALALMLNPALLRAQDTVLTINVASAEVHRSPSTASPVIGKVTRGMVLPVARNLGSWLKVGWPTAPDGAGYVHVTMGNVAPARGEAPAAKMSRTSSASTPVPMATAPMTRTSAEQVAPRRQAAVTPITHTLGVGGLVGSPGGFGATARAWRTKRVGLQFAFSRSAMTSDVAPGRVTSVQFEPGVVYALRDHVSTYFWVKPYVGSAVSFRHQTLSVVSPEALEPASDNGVGFRVFGGSELTFSGMPRFGLSVDLGYRKFPTPFPGFEVSPLSVSIAGHWYLR
jgi:hypothetical protein